MDKVQKMRSIFVRGSRLAKKIKKGKNCSVFVHIPKCAGGSIRQFCYANNILVHGHDARDPEYKFFHEIEVFREKFSFCFVRNPIDRCISAFKFLQGGGLNEGDRSDAERYVLKYDGNFQKFVTSEFSRGDILEQIHFSPQIKWIANSDGRIVVDAIFRYEEIITNFSKLQNLFGDFKSVLSTQNSSGTNRFPINFDTKVVSNMISSVYSKDIEMLGYA